MKKNEIQTQALEKALESLKRAIRQPLNEFNRDSVVQRFEYSFELSWKLLKKVIESDRPIEDISVRGILREAATQGLIQNLGSWFKFQEARNLTSHTYQEKTAQEVYENAIQFPDEIDFLIEQTKKRLKKK